MKAILEFELPDDQEQLNVASHGTDLWLTLWEIDQYLHTQIKHHDKPYQEVRDELYDIMAKYGVDLNMMS